MKHLRPYVTLVALAAGLAIEPVMARAQAQQITPLFEDSSTRAATVAPGYLGVDIVDVGVDKVQTLKLKDTHGAVITLIDHDAPAGQVGLRINDVVLQLDGQAIENADQFRRLLKDLPAGRKITLEISRDGALQTMAVALVDPRQMEQNVWHKLRTTNNNVPEMGMVSGDTMPSGFHWPGLGSTLKVGALVEPLTPQMAAHLGVESGLMVKQVAHKSEAAKSGLQAFDVILKVGADSIATSADWDRALRSNQGKPVQVTILRDKKQQTLTLQVDSKHQKSELDPEDLFGAGDREMVAELGAGIDENLAAAVSAQAEAAARAEQARIEAMREQIEKMQPDAAEQLEAQAEKLAESMKEFQADPRQFEQLQRQMRELNKYFSPPQCDRQWKQLQEQMQRLQQQMEEWSARAEGRFV